MNWNLDFTDAFREWWSRLDGDHQARTFVMAGHTSYNELRKQLSPEQRKRSTKKVEAMKIGLLVRQQREKAGLTQTQLGAQTGMSQQAISQIEWGEEIELSTLQKIFAALGGEIFVRMPDGNIPLPLTPSATADLSHPV